MEAADPKTIKISFLLWSSAMAVLCVFAFFSPGWAAIPRLAYLPVFLIACGVNEIAALALERRDPSAKIRSRLSLLLYMLAFVVFELWPVAAILLFSLVIRWCRKSSIYVISTIAFFIVGAIAFLAPELGIVREIQWYDVVATGAICGSIWRATHWIEQAGGFSEVKS